MNDTQLAPESAFEKERRRVQRQAQQDVALQGLWAPGWTQERQDAGENAILELLADGLDPSDVAMHLCDMEVAAGRYPGCSSELEVAASGWISLAEDVLRKAGG